MGRHLILTVHGIGEQKPGETVDQVAGAATTWLDGHPQPPVEIDRQMIELAETPFDGRSRNANLYKVHLRKVTKPQDSTDQALFAEVFWADRSPKPKGAIKTLVDLIWVVLALGYLAMDNVEQTHARKGVDPSDANGRNTFAAQIVHLFTWIFFGAVAPMNAFLLIGAAAVMIELLPVAFAQTPAALFGLLLLIYLGAGWVGLKRQKTAPTYLRRVFWRGAVPMGAVLALALVTGPLGAGIWGQMCDPTNLEITCATGLEQFVVFQILVLAAFWTALIFITIALYLVSLTTLQVEPALPGHRRLYPSICAGMLVFWMFFIAGLWLTFEQLVKSVPSLSSQTLIKLFDNNLRGSLDTLGVAFGAVVLLVVVGIGLFVGRKLGKEKLYEKHSFLSRAIVNRLAQGVFLVAAVVLGLVALRELTLQVLGLDLHCDIASGSESSRPDCSLTGKALNRLADAQGIIGIAVLGATAMLYRFSDFVAAGLGVARDIVTYAIRDKCALRWDLAARRRNYPARRLIDERFYRTLYYALDIFPADQITVISHSQGTVIATQMLADKRVQRRIKGRPVTLITMGAPVTHIYQRYFPEMFTVDPANLKAAWFNIFREDDFVGTRIEGDLIRKKRNIPVPPGGHTGYFTDHEVWRVLTGDEIGFDLFDPKTHQVPK